MKRIFASAFTLVVTAMLLLLSLQMPAEAANKNIYLTSVANRNYQGELINKDFEMALSPEGELGKLVFTPVPRPRTWIMDAALLEDIKYLAENNSQVAESWLQRLKSVIGNDNIYATAYGNPDVTYLNALAPSELNFYYLVGQQHLQAVLLKNVRSEKGTGLANKRATISNEIREFFNTARQEFTLLSTVVNPKEVESDRARLGQLFNPLLSEKQRNSLLKNFELGQPRVIAKLRIVSGRYQITNASEKLPITLVNDFNTPVKVDLLFTPLNSRVVFPEYRQITLNPNSKVQVSVPVKSIAAGDSTVIARFENGKGKSIGATGMLEVSSTIISTTITRFTTAAGVVLILAAIAQSVRRVRKNRKA